MLLNSNVWIKTSLFLLIFTSISLVLFHSKPTVQAASNPTISENLQTGSVNWQPDQAGLTLSDDKTKQVKGFASLTSVNKGSPIDFFITSNAPSFSIDVYRVGWYNSEGGRLMQQSGTLNGVIQPACPMDSSTGLLSCSNWSKSYTLNVPSTWTSGIYLAHMVTSTNFHDYIIFVVRDDNRTADLLYQQSVTTYQAYNDYPNDLSTGKSLYAFNSQGANTVGGDKRAVKVSYDRPYASANSFSSRGHGEGEFFSWEIHMVRWLEKNGYDVSYSTDIDTHANPNQVKKYKGFLSVGHDEYYTKQMYDGLVSARDSGVNLAFFGANAIYGQIRLESNSQGIPNRTQVYYRSEGLDPITDKSMETVAWRSLDLNPRPEQGLIGIQYSGHDTWNNTLPGGGDAIDYVVSNASNWAYANSGLTEGSHIPRIVGYETDRDMSAEHYDHPVNLSYTLLSNTTYVSQAHNNENDFANSVIYQAPSGAWVFGAGSIAWAWGLDNWRSQNYADAGIQQLTTNVLNKFISQPNPSLVPIGTPTPTPAATPVANSVTFTPEADSYIASDAPTNAQAVNKFLYVNGAPATNRKAFLRFNLTPLAGKTLTSAVLNLTTTSGGNAASTGTQNVHFLIDNSWIEQTLTWNNAPKSLISSTSIGSLTAANLTGQPYSIPLDLPVIQVLSGGLLSLVIDSASADDIVFASKEASTGRPQLVINFLDLLPIPSTSPIPTLAPTPTPKPSVAPTLNPTPTPIPSQTPTTQYRIFNNVVPGFISTSPYEVELGAKFRSTQPGKILGLRFYKGIGNTGLHKGTLWSKTGTQLATATFTNETIIGWQEVLFATPVLINANTTYVASYHTTTGHFAQSAPGFASAISNGPLTELQNGLDGPNGVYSASGFPTSTYNASNYYVDVIFQ